jgi:hypothetical protein
MGKPEYGQFYLAKVHILVHTIHRGWPMYLEIGVILFRLPV